MCCEHYKKNPFMLVAKCCDKLFWCRLCHDEQSDHKIDRYATEKMKCMKCHTRQKVGEVCTTCGTKVNYFCKVCKFWSDDNLKKFHCDKCGLCRVGKREDFVHCDKCETCMVTKKFEDHKCVSSCMKVDCPICMEYMFTSTIPVIILKCGHCIHLSCLEEYLKTDYRCPLCRKSTSDMTSFFAKIEARLAREQMPESESNFRSNISCNDCEKRSTAKFHYMYHKCEHCSSYNTNFLDKFVDERNIFGLVDLFQTESA